MKIRILTFIILAYLAAGCSSQRFNSFYARHKNDPGVTVFQVPRFVRSVLKNSGPELSKAFSNVHDFRSIKFNNLTPQQSALISKEIDQVTVNFTDVLRKNQPDGRILISVKEKKDRIKIVLIDKATENSHTVLYLKGNFSPDALQKLIDGENLDELIE